MKVIAALKGRPLYDLTNDALEYYLDDQERRLLGKKSLSSSPS
ncbi:hypothetical protein ACQQ2N_04545 [Dokdonella sp. MW10]